MAITNKVSELALTGADIYRGILGSTIPAKTLAAGGAWPVGWEKLGLTSAPLLLAYEAEQAAAQVQQALGDVDRGLTTEVWRLETKLAQVKNAEAMNIASGGTGTTATIAAGIGVPGSQEFKHGGKRFMSKYMYGFEGEHLDDASGTVLPVRGFFYRATPMPSWEIAFDKTKYAEGIALVIGALEDVTRTVGDRAFLYYFIEAPATS
jgi:hypothetical protein